MKVDSLLFALKGAKEDTIKMNILLELTENINDDKVWPKYNELAYSLAEKLALSKNVIIRKRAKTGLAYSSNNFGFIYANQGDIPKALHYYALSLKISEELDLKAGIASAFNNIAFVYSNQGDLARALEYNLKSLSIREDIKEMNGIATSLNNIGVIYTNQGDLPRAMNYYRKGLKIQKEINDKVGIARSLNNIGTIYKRQGDNDNALDNFTRSLKIQKTIGEKIGISYSLLNIAGIYFLEKKYSLSQSYSDSSLSVSMELGFPENIRNAEYLLSTIDSALGNYSGALEHYKKFIIYKDSIHNNEARKAGVRHHLKYEYEKKEAVIKEHREKERIISEEQNRRQQIIILSVAAGLLLVISFAAFVFRSLKTTRVQKVIIEQKQKDILDSIHYAKKIQQSWLPHEKYLDKNLKRLGKN